MKLLAALALFWSLSGAALACDCVRFIPGAPNWDRDISAVTEHASVILDAELVRITNATIVNTQTSTSGRVTASVDDGSGILQVVLEPTGLVSLRHGEPAAT